MFTFAMLCLFVVAVAYASDCVSEKRTLGVV